MKRGVLILGTALGSGGAVLLAAGYGAAGGLALALAAGVGAVAVSVRWRPEEVEGPPVGRPDGVSRG